MKAWKRVMIAATGTALWVFALGFVLFATLAMRDPGRQSPRADGIVVLTGGQTRIVEGARLLEEGRGSRLLISGVNPQIRRESVQRLSGLDDAMFNCCVDIDHAVDTIGNATETRRWAEAQHYTTLIIVTASYHMPRSLAELSRAMPGIKLIPHPVVPKDLRRHVWWLDATATRILVSEYLKFLPAAARLGASRVLGHWQTSSLASATAVGGPRS